ncbi:MAG: hypothetical protein LBR40_05335 [Bacilli bacterium]|jgi:hypothetical protein|nr:hypothetical protein [Bacilli bacterium]
MKCIINNSDVLLFNYQNHNYYGLSQLFYKKLWYRKAGCGPTTASNMIIYLALTNPYFKQLFNNKLTYDNGLILMNEMYQYITPTIMGVNNINIFGKGINKYLLVHEINNVSINNLDVTKIDSNNYDEIIDYLVFNLSNNYPVAFLNLDNGKVINLDKWHWVLIIGIEYDENNLFVMVVDDGLKKKIDLKLWLQTSNRNGGFVAINKR